MVIISLVVATAHAITFLEDGRLQEMLSDKQNTSMIIKIPVYHNERFSFVYSQILLCISQTKLKLFDIQLLILYLDNQIKRKRRDMPRH